MPYVTQAAIAGSIPRQFLVEALDDDRDGVPDDAVWDQVASEVAMAIDGPLSSRYAVPFDDPDLPPFIGHAARILALELLYARRGTPDDKNPWKPQADATRKTLEAMAEGSVALQIGRDRARPPISVISEPSKTHDTAGRLLS
jgi:phage gp36-like protein